jgi:hypothetical protein
MRWNAMPGVKSEIRKCNYGDPIIIYGVDWTYGKEWIDVDVARKKKPVDIKCIGFYLDYQTDTLIWATSIVGEGGEYAPDVKYQTIADSGVREERKVI